MSEAPISNLQAREITRVPPQSREAEICVLGAMILEPDSIDLVVHIAKGEYFYNPAHQQIFDTLVSMSQDNKPIDLVTLRNDLDTQKLLDEVGGVEYLVSLVDSVPNAANVEYYAHIVRDKALLRGLIKTATELCREAYDSTEEASLVLDRAEKKVFELAQSQVADSVTNIKDVIKQTFEKLESLDGSVTGVPTGFYKLDELTSGFQPGEMIIVAARPSMGKTAVALNLAENMAVDSKMPVLFFSLEMGRQQIVQRFLSSRAHFDQSLLRCGNISPDDWTNLHMAAGELEQSPIYIDDSPQITMLQMRAKARRMKSRYDIQCIFIDYLQLITPTTGESRQVQVSDISRNIKALARELNVPVVTLAQLNRSVEERVGHRPRMSDLRESGSIEQDADVISLLHRPDYFDKEAEPNVAELIVDKQRNGPTGIVKMTFLRECTRFENYHAPDEAHNL